MAGFLEVLSDRIIRDFGDDMGQLTVVFPNRRAGVFMHDILAAKMQQAGAAPRILTLEDFVSQLSELVLADRLTLIYQLYEVFREHADTGETFDRFYFWGEILLQDFSEVDMALVRAEDIFSNLRDLQALEDHYAYLSEEQQQTIARFWKSFRPPGAEEVPQAQHRFLKLWNRLLPVYQHFRERLLGQGLAYEGLMYRSLAESMQNGFHYEGGPLILAGMNALKNAEEELVRLLLRAGNTRIYWDADRHYVDEPVQEAGSFFRKYRKDKVLGESFPAELPDHFHSKRTRRIRIQGLSLEVGQAKKLGDHLRRLAQQPGFSPEQVAVILPDEHLLFPVLHSLPSEIRRVNVTMGYPLRNTSLFSFVDHLLKLQLDKKESGGRYLFHHQSLLTLLRHPYLQQEPRASARENIRHIERSNAVLLEAASLRGDDALFAVLLRPVEEVPALFDYLHAVISLLHELMTEEEEEGDEAVMSVPMLERELLYHFYLQVNRLRTLTRERQFDFQLPAFIRLLQQIFRTLRVPFTGEPLRGLQIMGLLESRNLDFRYVFVLSANEGVLPPAHSQHSFIPENLKKGFGLFTGDMQDAFYAHAFFRLLHQAEQVYLLHNTEDQQHLSGEMSRFLYQLRYEGQPRGEAFRFPDREGDFVVAQETLQARVAARAAQPIRVKKSPEVMNQMQRFLQGNRQHALTPSALNTYLDCRLKFYYQYVARLRESDEVQEEVDAQVFGNILHKTMELLYQRLMDRKQSNEVQAEDCRQVRKGKWLDKAIDDAFLHHFEHENSSRFSFEGRNIIAREIVRKMAVRILEYDEAYAPFKIISLEKGGPEGYFMRLPVDRAANQHVSLKGIIDRIDRKDGLTRVLDYKTGRDDRSLADVPSLFDREHPRRNKAAMQALFYALLYTESSGEAGQVAPGLVNAAELFGDSFEPYLRMGRESLLDFDGLRQDFVQGLSGLLDEIFNPEIDFDQTDDEKKCSYCPYVNICY